MHSEVTSKSAIHLERTSFTKLSLSLTVFLPLTTDDVYKIFIKPLTILKQIPIISKSLKFSVEVAISFEKI